MAVTPYGLNSSVVTAASSVTVTLNTAPASGDILTVVIGAYDPTAISITPPSGWTLIQSVTSSSGYSKSAYFQRTATSADVTTYSYTFTLASSSSAARIAIFGVTNATVDTTVSSIVGNINSATAPISGVGNAETAGTNELLIVFATSTRASGQTAAPTISPSLSSIGSIPFATDASLTPTVAGWTSATSFTAPTVVIDPINSATNQSLVGVMTMGFIGVAGHTYSSNLTDTFNVSQIDLTTENNNLLTTESNAVLITEQSGTAVFDTVSNNNIFNRSFSETFSFSDTHGKTVYNSRTTTDTSTFSNVLTRNSTYYRAETDGLNIFDNVGFTTVPGSGTFVALNDDLYLTSAVTPTTYGLNSSVVTAASSVTVALGTSPTVGDVLTAVVGAYDPVAISITPPAGWALIQSYTSGSGFSKSAYFQHTATTADVTSHSYTFNLASTSSAARVAIFGVKNATSDTSVSSIVGNINVVGTPIVGTGNAENASANELLIVFATSTRASGQTSAPSISPSLTSIGSIPFATNSSITPTVAGWTSNNSFTAPTVTIDSVNTAGNQSLIGVITMGFVAAGATYTDLTTENNNPLTTESGLLLVSEQSGSVVFDSLTNNNILYRSFTDTSTFTDFASKSDSNTRNFNETFTFSNSVVGSHSYTRTSSVTSTFADSINTTTIPASGSHTYYANLSDFACVQTQVDLQTENSNYLTTENNLLLVTEQSSGGSVDSAQIHQLLNRGTADTYFPSDSILKYVYSVHNSSENFTTSDSLNHQTIINRGLLAQNIEVDYLTRLVTSTHNETETFTTSDSQVHFAGAIYTVTETFTFSDSNNRQVTYNFNVGETFYFLDEALYNNSSSTNLADNFSTSDYLVRNVNYSRNTSDNTGGESDFENNNSILARNPSFTSITSDFENNQKNNVRPQYEYFSFYDSVNVHYSFTLFNVTETLTGSNSLSTGKIFTRNLSDSFSFTDSLSRKVIRHDNLTNTGVFSDASSIAQKISRNPVDTSVLNVNITVNTETENRFLSEVFHVIDNETRRVVYNRYAQETFNFNDHINYNKQILRNETIYLTTLDQLNTNNVFQRSATSTLLTVINNINRSYITHRYLSFTELFISDAITYFPIAVRNPIENIDTTDFILRNIFNSRAYTDTLKLFKDNISGNHRTYLRNTNESFGFIDFAYQRTPITYDATTIDSFNFTDSVIYNPSIFGNVVTVQGTITPNSRVAFLYNGIVGLGTVQYIDWSSTEDSVVISVFSQYYSILSEFNLNDTSITVPISQCALLPVGYS
jgi:hypothetical protein